MEDRKTIVMSSTKMDKSMKEVIEIVYDALEDRGYNPIDQMVGYILSGDPSYITSHNNARNMISRLDRDELVEEILRKYLNK
ncbi:MAG: IreB family regulatory phosphoprotein [Clostridia bacterium]|nr:IreB family regulatory phosphoprotein [Clostridia bacterium]